MKNLRKKKGLSGYLIVFSIFIFLAGLTDAYSKEITEAIIKNLSYKLDYADKAITLTDGKHSSGSTPEDFLKVNLENFKIVDLDGDKTKDAVIVLSSSFGGLGIFFELTAILNKRGEFIQTNSVKLGDRIKIKELKAQPAVRGIPRFSSNATVLISMLTHSDKDPSCCPSVNDVKCFTLHKNRILSCEEAPPEVVRKPALYLYPERDSKIEVILLPKGEIIESIPAYTGKWLVTATPHGKIDNKYDYLFYEVELENSFELKQEGFKVKHSDLEK